MWDLSYLTRDQTHVPCIGRQILNQWTTKEVPAFSGFSWWAIYFVFLTLLSHRHTYVCAQSLSCFQLLTPHGLEPARLLCPWDFSGKTTGVGCHLLFQGIFPTHGSNSHLLHCRQISLQLSHQGSPYTHLYLPSFLFSGLWKLIFFMLSIRYPCWKNSDFLLLR